MDISSVINNIIPVIAFWFYIIICLKHTQHQQSHMHHGSSSPPHIYCTSSPTCTTAPAMHLLHHCPHESTATVHGPSAPQHQQSHMHLLHHSTISPTCTYCTTAPAAPHESTATVVLVHHMHHSTMQLLHHSSSSPTCTYIIILHHSTSGPHTPAPAV